MTNRNMEDCENDGNLVREVGIENPPTGNFEGAERVEAYKCLEKLTG